MIEDVLAPIDDQVLARDDVVFEQGHDGLGDIVRGRNLAQWGRLRKRLFLGGGRVFAEILAEPSTRDEARRDGVHADLRCQGESERAGELQDAGFGDCVGDRRARSTMAAIDEMLTIAPPALASAAAAARQQKNVPFRFTLRMSSQT